MFNSSYFASVYFNPLYFYTGSDAYTTVDYIRIDTINSSVSYISNIVSKIGKSSAYARITYKGT